MTLQDALKQVYASLGGDISNLRYVYDINAILMAVAKLDINKKISGAVEFPTLPEEDGTYTLTVTIADGEATYAWAETPAEGGTE